LFSHRHSFLGISNACIARIPQYQTRIWDGAYNQAVAPEITRPTPALAMRH